MAETDEPFEARPTHNAFGNPVAASPDEACGNTYIAGYAAVFDCALPKGHGGSHESFAGSSWAAVPGGESDE